jgi:hypothetical protein
VDGGVPRLRPRRRPGPGRTGSTTRRSGVIFRLYEVYPQGHPRAGRRRFKRGGISVRKGWAKTELGAALAAAELHPDAPVRCDGFDAGELAWSAAAARGEPVGVGVDPYIPMVAFTEEQSEELAYGALVVMLGEGPLADDFDLGVERILVIGEDGKAAGKAVALAAAPNSETAPGRPSSSSTRRTARTRTACGTRTRRCSRTSRSAGADAWSLEVTTSYEPGKDSIAERTHNYAKLVAEGELDEPSLFYYNRYASDRSRPRDPRGPRGRRPRGVRPGRRVTDVDYVVGLSYDPDVDLQYWERVWLNREVSSSGQFFPVGRPRERDGASTTWPSRARTTNPSGSPSRARS